MASMLPLNLEDLLRRRTVESDRIEYKKGWNPDPIFRTLCAFANDFENLGGGYVIIGQDCDANGQPIFPPAGIAESEIDKIQQELLRYCNLIQPTYFPQFYVESFAGKTLIVLWSPGGQNRPYKVPRAVTSGRSELRYFIRRFSSTVEAKGDDERELISLTATVPFDDRVCHRASIEDLRLSLVRSFLKEVGSGLYDEAATLALLELGRRLSIVDGADEVARPRNVGVLFFNEDPERFIPGVQIDIVHFPRGPGGGEMTEHTFKGPLQQQLRDALRHLQNNVIREKVVKVAARAEATRVFNYPFAALEEALVNAVYHRSYEQREPIEVRIGPDSIDILSYPGPDASIKTEALNGGKVVARRYRNRRIGEFLKELKLTEGRCTGIPTIRRALAENGSHPARFSSDEGRTHFLVEFQVHPDFKEDDLGGAPEVTPEVTPEVQLVSVIKGEMGRSELMKVLSLKDPKHFRQVYLQPAIDLGLVEMTLPEAPRSSKQKYRLTAQGRSLLEG